MSCCAVLLVALSLASSGDPSSEVVLPPRTTLAIKLDTTIKTNRAHVGDPVMATLVAPVLLNGVIVVPKAAKLKGHVLGVRAYRDGVRARLTVGFEEARWVDHSVKVNAFIVHQIIDRVVVSPEDDGCTPATPDPSTAASHRNRISAWAGCSGGSFGTMSAGKTVLSTPPMKDVIVRRGTDPPHTIELVSTKKNIVLHRGMKFELRHIEQYPQTAKSGRVE